MKIGIYGGTFNPVHYGHLRTAQEVLDTLLLDRILFMPSGLTPFDKPDLAKAERRYRMVKMAIEGNPDFKVSAIEIKTEGRSYTVDTVKKLQSRYSRSELFFILGIDAFLDFPAWKQPDRLLNMINLVIIKRPGYTFSQLSSSPYLGNVSKKTLRELDRRERLDYAFDIFETRKGYLCNVTELGISATGIRKMIMSGGNIKYLLPDSVKSYIISNELYKKPRR